MFAIAGCRNVRRRETAVEAAFLRGEESPSRALWIGWVAWRGGRRWWWTRPQLRLSLERSALDVL